MDGRDPVVTGSTPRWVIGVSVVLAWGSAVATALLFAGLGALIDGAAVTATTLTTLGLLALCAAGCAGGGVWFSEWADAETERRLRRITVSRIFTLGVAGTADRAGELLSLSTGAVERAAHYRAGFLGPMIGALTTPLLVLVVMAVTVDAPTAGWLVLLLVLVPLTIGGFQRLARPIGAAYRRSQGQLTAGFLEAIQALPALVYARAGDRVGVDLAGRSETHRRRLMRLLAGNQLLIFVVDAAFSLTVVVAAAVIAMTRIGAGELRLGEGIAILLMTTLVIGPVDIVGQFFYIGIGGRAAEQQLSAHVQRAQRPTDTADADGAAEDRQQPRSSGIVLEGVTAGWPGGPNIIRDVTLRVAPGERVALVGPSGIGKSTIAALIQGQLHPRTGTITVDGRDARTGESRSRLAVVEQRAHLFLGTIAENLRIADADATDDRLWQALEFAGLDTEVAAMPRQLLTAVGEQGTMLSGGQAQRLAIARAWLRDAPVLLLDEPTSNVDLAGEAAILERLERLSEGRTVLMIAHRPSAILTADRIVELSRGGDAA